MGIGRSIERGATFRKQLQVYVHFVQQFSLVSHDLGVNIRRPECTFAGSYRALRSFDLVRS